MRPGAWAAELRRGRGAESLSCGARLRSDAGGWDRAVGDAASARRERGSVRSKGLTGRSRAPGRCARADSLAVVLGWAWRYWPAEEGKRGTEGWAQTRVWAGVS